ncbi:hypothetical protein C5E51_34890 [Nocardia nova]|nr:hypothetical protein C5E51_34890 [Nocardia nova]PPJ21289.1 hypothetical protein C5E44_06930 [Nocardia nova]
MSSVLHPCSFMRFAAAAWFSWCTAISAAAASLMPLILSRSVWMRRSRRCSIVDIACHSDQ